MKKKQRLAFLAFLLLLPCGLFCKALGSLEGSVAIEGHIKKVQKKFDPYAELYGDSSSTSNKEDEEEPGHLIVYLDNNMGSFPVPSQHAVLDQKERQFTSDLVPILAGQSVDFTNHDHLYHNVFSYSELQPFDLGRRKFQETRSVKFGKLPSSGIGVIKVFCEIHSHMRSHILVMRNPFWAVLPETGGKFKIANIPAGNYTLNGWHYSLQGSPQKFSIKPGQTTHIQFIMKGEK